MIGNQRGFSLIEIMIALVIGLIIIVALGQVFLGNKQTYKTQEDLARMQEDARFALETMSRAMRIAGYKGNGSAAVFPNPVLDGTDSGSATGSDSLIVRYAGSDSLGAPGTADGSVTDCLGVGVALNTISFNRFYIANDPANNNEPTLFCDTTDDGVANGTALIPGVES
ncbi:MAG: PilW family protein, partial [Burkholderiales bacterium]